MTIEDAKKAALEAVHQMAKPKCPVPAYVEALEEVIEEVDMLLTAARDDMDKEGA